MYDKITSNTYPYYETSYWTSDYGDITCHLHKDSEPYKFLSSEIYKNSIAFGKVTNVVMPIVSDIMTGYSIYKKYITPQPNKYNNYDWTRLKSKLDIHEDVYAERSGALPKTSTPMSSKDLYVKGELWQRRYYDAEGKCIKDIDFMHGGKDTHVFPHEHFWTWKDNGKLDRSK